MIQVSLRCCPALLSLFRSPLAGCLALLLTACGPVAIEVPSEPVIRPVRIETMSLDASSEPGFNGMIQAANQAELGGEGIESKVNHEDWAKEGPWLAKIDPKGYEIALSLAKAAFHKADEDYQRGLAIFKQSQALSTADLQTLQRQRDVMKNRLDEAEQNLADARLLAPFSSIIGRLLTENHTQALAHQPELALHDLKQLEVVIDVPGRQLLSGGLPNKAYAMLSQYPHKRIPLALKHYAADFDPPPTQSYQVIFSVSSTESKNLLPGMAVKVHSEPDPEQVFLSLPLSALQADNQGRLFVWKLNEAGLAVRQFVQTGPLFGDRIHILEGLEMDDRVITADVTSITEGMRVRPLDDGEMAQ